MRRFSSTWGLVAVLTASVPSDEPAGAQAEHSSSPDVVMLGSRAQTYAHWLRAQWALERGKASEAANELLLGLVYDERALSLRVELATLRLRQGQFQRAEHHIQALDRYHPRSPDRFRLWSQLWSLRAESSRAIHFALRTIYAGGRSPRDYIHLIALLRKSHMNDRALRWSRQGVRRHPLNKELWHLLADLQVQNGEWRNARASLERGARNSVDDLVALAELDHRLGESSLAQQRLKVALTGSEPNAKLWLTSLRAALWVNDRSAIDELAMKALDSKTVPPESIIRVLTEECFFGVRAGLRQRLRASSASEDLVFRVESVWLEHGPDAAWAELVTHRSSEVSYVNALVRWVYAHLEGANREVVKTALEEAISQYEEDEVPSGLVVALALVSALHNPEAILALPLHTEPKVVAALFEDALCHARFRYATWLRVHRGPPARTPAARRWKVLQRVFEARATPRERARLARLRANYPNDFLTLAADSYERRAVIDLERSLRKRPRCGVAQRWLKKLKSSLERRQHMTLKP